MGILKKIQLKKQNNEYISSAEWRVVDILIDSRIQTMLPLTYEKPQRKNYSRMEKD